MKIAHLVDTMEVGGAEMLVMHLCRYQRQHGHAPSVHCLYRVGPLGEQLRSEGFPIVEYGGGSQLSLIRRVRTALSGERPDAVHCHNATPTIVGAWAARRAGARSVISTRHGSVPPPYKWRREAKYGIASRWCDHIVAVCNVGARNMKEAPLAAADRVVTVYNCALPAPGSPDDALRARKSGWLIVWVGRLAPPKDPATLVRAVAEARRQVPELQLWFVGAGTLRAETEALVRSLGLEQTITFFGERKDVGAFLALADLFVLSSTSEGIPVSQLEAMAAGLPALVTDAGGMPEAVAPGAGEVVPVGDVAALSSAIVDFHSKRSGREATAAKARAHFAANFSVDRMCQAYQRLYESPR